MNFPDSKTFLLLLVVAGCSSARRHCRLPWEGFEKQGLASTQKVGRMIAPNP